MLSSDHPAQPSGSQPGIPIIKSIWQVTRIRGKTAKHPEWGLSFYNIHTGEYETVEYCLSGCLISPSLERINHILRDHRTGEMKDIDVRLLIPLVEDRDPLGFELKDPGLKIFRAPYCSTASISSRSAENGMRNPVK